MAVLSALLGALSAPGCRGAAPQAAQPSLAVYRVPGMLGDTRPTPLDELRLSALPLLTDSDLVWYDWSVHEFQVSEDAGRRLPLQDVLAPAFVLVVDGVRIYAGAFCTGFSSYSCSAPAIMAKVHPTVLVIRRA